VSEAYRPGSYSVDAIGESSQCMLIVPSNGRCGSGRTIFASTCASTLQYAYANKRGRRHVSSSFLAGGKRLAQSPERVAVRNRVLPREHSTWPSSGPNERSCGRAWRNSRPSRRAFWSRAAKKKSFSGIEGDGGRMNLGEVAV